MKSDSHEVTKAEVKDWLVSTVAVEIEDLRQEEISAEHAQDWYRGVLAWFAKYFIDDDPSDLFYADGPNDGGIDIASISTDEGQMGVHVYQLSTLKPESLAQGRILKLKQKYESDVRGLHRTLTGTSKKIKKLNATAQDVLRQINRAREYALEGDYRLSIEIHPLTLKQAHPDSRLEVQELATTAAETWGTDAETWSVHPIKDVFDLFQSYQKKRPKDASPEMAKINCFGKLCADRAERGPFLAFLSAADLVELYQKWGAGLLDSNLRFSLGKTEVNKKIENELSHLSSITHFHEKNNGIVLICNSCQPSKDLVRLHAPQVINGGQTIHSISRVIEDLESVPPDKRTEDQRKRLSLIKSELKLSARIVVVSGRGGAAWRSDEIAIASNTQNQLSERTLRSASHEMRDLKRNVAQGEVPWFVTTKDGEWSAIKRNKALFQSKTGNRRLQDFKIDGSTRHRRVENTDLGVAALAFYGFVDLAKPSRVFRKRQFATLFGSRVKSGAWRQIAKHPLEWQGEAFGDLFEEGQPSASQWMLFFFCWQFWKTFTYPETRQLLMAYEERGNKSEEFRARYKKKAGWDAVPEEVKEETLSSADSCYWPEQIVKSCYLVLTYQSMRVLYKCFGDLDDQTCKRILELRQFRELNSGQSMSKMTDFRQGSLQDGPLTSIGRLLHYSCTLLWQKHEERIRQMASRQQVLLQGDWIARLSEKVDDVCDRVSNPTFLHASNLEGSADRERRISGLDDLMR